MPLLGPVALILIVVRSYRYPPDTVFTLSQLNEFPEGLSEQYKDEFDRVYQVQ